MDFLEAFFDHWIGKVVVAILCGRRKVKIKGRWKGDRIVTLRYRVVER